MQSIRRALLVVSASLLATAGAGNVFAFDGPIMDLLEGTEDFSAAWHAQVNGHHLSRLDRRAENRLPKVSYDRILLHFVDSDGGISKENGWSFTVKAGTYGTNDIQSALVTVIGLGANRPQDAVYPTSLKPNLVENYSGAYKDSLRFAKGQLKGFRSLTRCDENMFLTANPIDRYSMSVRTNPVYKADGSLAIGIQHNSPGKDGESNWLPAPKGKFHLMMRFYLPDETPPSIIDGSWTVPAVTKV